MVFARKKGLNNFATFPYELTERQAGVYLFRHGIENMNYKMNRGCRK